MDGQEEVIDGVEQAEIEPVETPAEEKPVETTPTAPETAKPEPILYEIEGGKKVTGEELAQHYKSLNSEFTRRSQRLAEIERNKTEEKPWQKEGWEPQSYAEMMEATKESIRYEEEQRKQAELEQRKAIDEYVAAEIAEIKKTDPSVDENRVMAHAAKLGIRSLVTAHADLKDREREIKLVEERILKNMKARSADPTATSTTTAPATPQFRPGMSMRDKARAFARGQ